MPVATSTLLGRPLWYELMTTDMKAAETFYQKVIGWTSAPFEGSPQPYSIFSRSAEAPIAGVLTTPRGCDGAAVLGDVRGRGEAGGKQRPDRAARGRRNLAGDRHPQDRPHADDEGSAGRGVLHLEPASTEQPPEAAAEVGEASWHELMTTDAAAAMTFYSEIFGWQPSEALDMGPMGNTTCSTARTG